MGLDAYVRCSCWVDGKAEPFEQALVDDEGSPSLDLPYAGNEALHARFRTWLDGACPHPGMQLASVRISNWSGYRVFQEALGRLGWERFPTLHQELPEGNGGAMPAAQAERALAELGAFTQASAGIEEVVLVDSDTDKVEYDHVASYDGVFVWSGSKGYELGFDPRGLFVRKPEKQGGEELFRAMRVDRPPGAFVDRDAGTRLECPLAWGEDRRFHVTRRPAPADRYARIVAALETVCRAAVASGNPVIWT